MIRLYTNDPETHKTIYLPCTGGSFTFEEWGMGSGRIEVSVPAEIGEWVHCVDFDKYVWIFSAVVTKREYDHKRQMYTLELKDPVSAVFGGEVEFSAGTATEVLEEISEAAGGWFNTDFTSPETDIFGTYEDPIQWVDLVKTISLTEGAYVAFSPETGYMVNADNAFQNEYGPGGIIPISPFSATTTLDMDRYGNSAVVTIDADWTEETSTEVTTTETGYGITRTIIKIGEQPQSVTTDLGDGYGVTEEWTWDEDGNLTRYDRAESSELEKTEGYTTYTIGDEGSLVVYEETIVQKRDNPFGEWFYYRKYMKTTTTNVDDGSPTQVDEYTSWYFPEEPEWHNKYWVRTLALAAMPGVIASYKVTSYEWSEITETFFLQKTETMEGELTKPWVTKILPVNKIGKHFSSTANDDDSIDAIGEQVQEFDAFGLTTIDDVETAAGNFLTYCERANTATVEVATQPFCVGDNVSWNGYTWVVEGVTVDLSSWRTRLQIARSAGVADVTDAVLSDANNIAKAVVALIEKKGTRLNNAARAQVVAQIDYETYQVHIQGEPADKTRIAKADYQKGVIYSPGKEVLLVRPTGKNSRWEIVSKRNEEPTVITTVGGDVYVPITTSISMGRSIYLPYDTILMQVDNLDRAVKIQASWGDEGEEVIRTYTRGEGGNSGVVFWTPSPGNEQYEDFGDNLQSGYGNGFLIRDILAPLDPATNPEQECSGKIRLQGAQAEWTEWKTFSYTIKAPQVKKCDYTLGEPYEGSTAADVASAPVVDATFKVNVDFSPWLPSRWEIKYGYFDGATFKIAPDYYSVTRTHFRLIDGTTPVAITGIFEWRFSADGDDWHADPQPDDLFVQVGNGTAWGDVLEVEHGKSTSYWTFGEIVLFDGQGTKRLFDWFDLDKDENGDAEISSITYRLGYSGPGQYYQSSGLVYTSGPPYPGIETEFNPYMRTDLSYIWQERGDIV